MLLEIPQNTPHSGNMDTGVNGWKPRGRGFERTVDVLVAVSNGSANPAKYLIAQGQEKGKEGPQNMDFIRKLHHYFHSLHIAEM